MKLLAVTCVFLCLFGWPDMGCQARRMTPSKAPLPTVPPAPSPSPVLTPLPLTEAQAMALVEEEVSARGVDPTTLRVTVGGSPRSVSVRYESSYNPGGQLFQIQTTLVALDVARVVGRIEPPIDGEIRLSVMPVGESDIGLWVTIIDRALLDDWIGGAISDQQFAKGWTVGVMPKE